MIEMSELCFPADRVMKGEYLETLPTAVADDMTFEYRDRSNDEAEETLREESEYWHGMSEVGPEWFFTFED
jgi:hypothetical protein